LYQFVGEDGRKYESEIDSFDFPKKNSYQRGCSYQYIRMEYCSGGDLEEVVRRAGQLNLSTVKSILFQIFFAFYAGREKLCLRHFDVKLLNFFVSDGSCLLSPTQKEEYDKTIINNNNNNNENNNNNNNNNENKHNINNNNNNTHNSDTIKMRVGFGDHVFSLPLQISSLSVVKLADFGTSAVGAAGLGESVTAQQVRI
jgi:serine/threonine protein kinase